MRTGDRVACATLCVLAGCLLAAPVGQAAPVPKALKAKPAKLTADLLTGKWVYGWGESTGWVEFRTDGTYDSQLSVSGANYYGKWAVEDDGAVVLYEWATNRGPCHMQVFRLTLGTDDWPAVAGRFDHADADGRLPPDPEDKLVPRRMPAPNPIRLTARVKP